jgi:hypothetical protein
MINGEIYKESFSIPDSSGVPGMETIQRRAEIVKARKKAVYKKVVTAVCMLIAAFVLSNGICYAATGESWLRMLWSVTLENGTKVELKEDPQGGIYARADGHWDDKGYTVYEDGRTYFVFGDIRTDITDIVAGGKDYYKYEYTDEQGIRHIIVVGEMMLDEVVVGGGKEYVSLWREYLYYPNGHVGGVGSVPEVKPEWLKKADRDYLPK